MPENEGAWAVFWPPDSRPCPIRLGAQNQDNLASGQSEASRTRRFVAALLSPENAKGPANWLGPSRNSRRSFSFSQLPGYLLLQTLQELRWHEYQRCSYLPGSPPRRPASHVRYSQ